jgi:hypothetical protein
MKSATRLASTILIFFPAAFPLLLLGAPPESSAVRAKLVDAKVKVMAADYGADLTALASVRRQLEPLKDDPALGYLADYWSGYASWRIAINGANASMSQDDLRAHLGRAVADFETSARKKDDFADAFAAAASVHGWLTSLNRADPDVMKAHMETFKRMLARAEELEPNNPRVLWVRGGYFLFAPPTYGGSTEKAIEIYRKQAASSGPLTPDSPFPDWGKAEALMSLAFAHFSQPTPDLEAAAKEAHEALTLAPHWSYVRDILAPQIEEKRKKVAQ